MKRREFISLAIGATATWPFAARAQQPAKRPLIGYLSAVSREPSLSMIDAFVGGLRELGYVEGQEFDAAFRFADGHLDRLSVLADEMISLQPDVILSLP